jgi:HEAT repeat protein
MGLARISPFAAAGVAISALALALASGGSAAADPWRPLAAPEAWTSRLQHPDPAVRRAALWVLAGRELPRGGSAGTRIVTQVAAIAQRDRDPGAAAAAVFVLSRAGTPEARAALRDLSGAPTSPTAVRAAALRAYTLTGDTPSSFEGLLHATRGGTLPFAGDAWAAVAERTVADLPDAAFGALVRASHPSTGESSGRVGVLRAIGRRGDPRWGAVLAEALRVTRRNSAGFTAIAALEAVAHLRLTELAEPVVALARSDADLTVRHAAVRALGALGGAFDPAVLRGLLAEPGMREPCLDALGALGDVGSIPAVTALLDATWGGDRAAAALALAAIGSPTSIASLAARAEREDEVDVRRTLLRAIAHIGGALAREALVPIDDPTGRWALAELLVGDPALARPPRSDASDASGAVVAGLAGAPSSEGLRAEEAGRRVAAALAFGVAPGADLGRVDALGAALARESHEGVRVALVGALAELAAREEVSASTRGAACGLLLGLVEQEEPELSLAGVSALAALGRLRVAAAASVALRVVVAEHRSPLVRRVALLAAARLGVRSARWVASRTLVSDPDDAVRGAAAVALATLLGAGAEPYLRAVSLAAGSPVLIDQIAAAQGAVGFRARAQVRASGAEPGSVWTLSLPDGGVAFGVATDDGELWLRGATEAGDGELTRVNAL